ncbi:MAG: ELM1/GtrOC1 family putative glycosyltransferase, partial [Gammaproteobacteria bacterium]
RHPSPEFRVEGITGSERGRRLAEWMECEWSGIVSDLDAGTLLYYGQGRLTGDLAAPSRPVRVTVGTPVRLQAGNGGTGGAYDLVVAGNLESVPEWDLPWLLDHLFARAGRALTVAVDITRRGAAPADPLWWWAQLSDAGRRYPAVHWRLAVRHRRRLIPDIARWSGGPPAHIPPRTWVLLYYKSGHRSQALGTADSLGLPYETREIHRTMLRYAAAGLTAMVARKLGTAGRRLPGGIEPPWPDVIISSGWMTGLIARWVARRTGGATRLVLMGRKAGPVGESEDVVVSCGHFQLPPHPRRIETLLPPSKVNRGQLEEAAARWPQLFGDRPSPRVVLLIGGSTRSYRLDGRDAGDLLNRVQAQVREAGGTLAVLTSPRTGRAATLELQRVAGEDVIVDFWQKGRRDNPYLGYLDGADILIVTGESESMLAEAVTAGKPVYIAPLPRRRQTPLQWAGNWVHAHAHRDRFNKRGSRRPQQGLQYLCALLVEHRLILPERGLEQLHNDLVEAGLARFLGSRLECWRPQPWREPAEVAARIRELLGLAPFPDSGGTCEKIDVAARD